MTGILSQSNGIINVEISEGQFPQRKPGDEVETVNAHTGVLRAASPVLNAMLSGRGENPGWFFGLQDLLKLSGSSCYTLVKQT